MQVTANDRLHQVTGNDRLQVTLNDRLQQVTIH